MGLMMRHVGDAVRSKLQNMMKNPTYEEAVNNADVIIMWRSMKMVTTGNADLSFNQDIKELIGMRMKGTDWAAHFTRFKRCRRRIEQRQLSDEEFRELTINTAFINSISQSGMFEMELNQVYRKPKYPNADELMDELTLIAQATEINRKNNTSGAIAANKIKMMGSDYDEHDLKPPLTERHESERITEEVKAMNVKSTKNEGQKMTCFNCCKVGHGSRRCTQPKAPCETCGREHNTKMHILVIELEKRKRNSSTRAMRLTIPTGVQEGFDELAGSDQDEGADSILAHIRSSAYQNEPDESEHDVQAFRSTTLN
jgi:hypothetical protein